MVGATFSSGDGASSSRTSGEVGRDKCNSFSNEVISSNTCQHI